MFLDLELGKNELKEEEEGRKFLKLLLSKRKIQKKTKI